MDKVKVLSLFSGAGGLDLGLERAGMEVIALCEIDSKARSVLRKHWPDTPIYTDVKEVNRERLTRDGIGIPDLVAGGSPCQDLSVAGRRKGLDGSRSGLFWEQCRIADEYEADIFWENVPGALSSNDGADFAAVLWGITGALVELPPKQKWAKAGVIVGPKRTAIWRVADAQRFGVPQRRRRVYVVGCSGTVARRLAPLLLESTSSQGNHSAGREAGTRAPRTTADSSDADSGPRAGQYGNPDGVSPTVTSKWAKGSGGPAGDEVQNLTTSDISAWIKSKRASSDTDDDTWRDQPVSPTLNSFDNAGESRATVLAVHEPNTFRMVSFGEYTEDDQASSLKARDYKDATDLIGYAFQPADSLIGKGGLRAVQTDVAPTIARGDHHSDRGLRILQVDADQEKP